MEVYHEFATPTVAIGADESARPPVVRNPFAYDIVPPVGRLLDLLCEHLSIGGCFRPGNRQLADWLGYASASQMPALLSELACKGYILYDRDSRLITLLRDYRTDQAIRSPDRSYDASDESTHANALVDSALIDPIDRDLAHPDAEYESDQLGRSIPQRMEDSCLTATESESESVVVKETKIPCAADSISPTDHPILLLLTELGLTLGRGVFERGMAARPWTPQQIRDRYEYDKLRIKNSGGSKTWGIFWTAFIAGELAPPDPNRPLDPESYASQPGFKLGSDAAPPDEAERRAESYADAHWRAVALLGKGAPFRDLAIVVNALVEGATDDQALAELTAERQAVP